MSSGTYSAWSMNTRIPSRESSGTRRPFTTIWPSRPTNWDHDTTFHNILEKLSPQQVQGSTWDPDSIMEYEFEPGLIDEPEQYDINGLIAAGNALSSRQEMGPQVVSAVASVAEDAAAVPARGRRPRRRSADRFRNQAHGVPEIQDRDEGRIGHDARAVRRYQWRAAISLWRRRQRRGAKCELSATSFLKAVSTSRAFVSCIRARPARYR